MPNFGINCKIELDRTQAQGTEADLFANMHTLRLKRRKELLVRFLVVG